MGARALVLAIFVLRIFLTGCCVSREKKARILPHRLRSIVTAFSNAPPHFTYVFHFTGNVFSTGKQPLAPFELIFAVFYGMLTILHIGVAKGLLCRCDCCTVLSEGGFCM